MKLSIVIPCYNEEKNIPLIVEKFASVINRADVEVILVNNGSVDNSQKVIEELLTFYTFLKTTIVDVNQGYGYGILQGLKASSGDFLGWTHADMQTDPKDVLRALEIIEKNGDAHNLYVKGNRKGRSIFDNFFTVGMSVFESIYLGTSIYDINAQPNIFHRDFYKRWENPPHDFSLDLYTYYLAKKMKIKVKRFDVKFPERINGKSSWNNGFKSKWKFIKRTFDFSIKLKRGISK